MYCQLIIDPLGKYPSGHDEQIKESLGLIPSFVLASITDITGNDSIEFMDAMKGYYGFPTYEMGGTVEEDVYKYPEDEDLYPLAKYDFGDTHLLQYEYGILSYVDGDKVNTVRMD
jgi:hypothetical protein